jgi:hypothetical protein
MTGVGLRRLANTRETDQILHNAMAAAESLAVDAGGTAPNHVGTDPFDWQKARAKNAPDASGTGLVDDPVERFVWAAMQNEDVRTMLNTLRDRRRLADTDGDGFLEITDAWEEKLGYVQRYAPGSQFDASRAWHPHSPEQWDDPFFVSGGRDRDLTTTEDNRYSFDLDRN